IRRNPRPRPQRQARRRRDHLESRLTGRVRTQRSWRVPLPHHARGRALAGAPRYRPHRRLPPARLRRPDTVGGAVSRPRRPGAPGQSPLRRRLQLPSLADLPGAARSRARINASPLIAAQNPYSLLNRELEREMFPFARASRIGIMAYAPLAIGLLSGAYRPDAPPSPSTLWARKGPDSLTAALSGRPGDVIRTAFAVAERTG